MPTPRLAAADVTELLFAYGSLVSAESAAATLGRIPPTRGVVRLAGWRRRWSLARDNVTSEKTFARAEGGELPSHCLGLNLEPAAEESGPNGVVYEVKEDDLKRLDLREVRYERVVSGEYTAYVAKPEHFAARAPAGAIVIAAYLRTIEAAFASLGADELEVFRATTETPPVEVIDAVLVEDRIPPGNPRDW